MSFAILMTAAMTSRALHSILPILAYLHSPTFAVMSACAPSTALWTRGWPVLHMWTSQSIAWVKIMRRVSLDDARFNSLLQVGLVMGNCWLWEA
jgi:hypothetical protein